MKTTFRLTFCLCILAALPAAASTPDRRADAQECAAAPQEYENSLAACENSRRSAARIERCRQKVKSRYEETVETCVSARKAGEAQQEFLGLPGDPPKEPPPKDPPPKPK